MGHLPPLARMQHSHAQVSEIFVMHSKNTKKKKSLLHHTHLTLLSHATHISKSLHTSHLKHSTHCTYLPKHSHTTKLLTSYITCRNSHMLVLPHTPQIFFQTHNKQNTDKPWIPHIPTFITLISTMQLPN